MTDREYLLSLCGQLPDPEVKTVRYRRILAWSVGSRSSSADRTAWCQFLRDCFGRQYFSIVGAPRPSHSSCGSSSNSMERRTLLFPRPRFLMVCINLPPNWPTLNPCAAARSRNAPSSAARRIPDFRPANKPWPSSHSGSRLRGWRWRCGDRLSSWPRDLWSSDSMPIPPIVRVHNGPARVAHPPSIGVAIARPLRASWDPSIWTAPPSPAPALPMLLKRRGANLSQ